MAVSTLVAICSRNVAMIDFSAPEYYFTAGMPRSPRKAFGLVKYGDGTTLTRY